MFVIGCLEHWHVSTDRLPLKQDYNISMARSFSRILKYCSWIAQKGPIMFRVWNVILGQTFQSELKNPVNQSAFVCVCSTSGLNLLVISSLTVLLGNFSVGCACPSAASHCVTSWLHCVCSHGNNLSNTMTHTLPCISPVFKVHWPEVFMFHIYLETTPIFPPNTH